MILRCLNQQNQDSATNIYSKISAQYLREKKCFLIRKFKVDNGKNRFEKTKKIFFLHIPKTGGTTIVESFLEVYEKLQEGLVLINSHSDNLFKMSESDIKKNYSQRLIFHGHFNYGAHKHIGLADDEVCYFALVRDPVALILSMYNWAYQNFIISEQVDFNYFLRQSNNLQTKIIAGVTKFNREENHACYSFFDDNQIDEVVYQQAIKNIEKHFALIGNTENLNDFMKVFITKMALSNIVTHSSNEGKIKLLKELTPQQVAEIKERNYWDLKLHDYVRKKFANIYDELCVLNDRTKIDVEAWKSGRDANEQIIVAGSAVNESEIVPTKLRFLDFCRRYGAAISSENRINS